MGPRHRLLFAPAATWPHASACFTGLTFRWRHRNISRTAAGCTSTSPRPADFGLVDSELSAIRGPHPPDRRRRASSSPPLLFPVYPDRPSPLGNFDTLKIEASDYDDGFAKIVHAAQPVSANVLSEEPDGLHVQKDMGIRLGWDDEQILIWQNRQVLADPRLLARVSTLPWASLPIASMSAQKGQPDWGSLVRIRNKKELTLAGQSVSPAKTVARDRRSGFPRQDQRRHRRRPTGCPVTSRNGMARPWCCRTTRPPSWTRAARSPNPGRIPRRKHPARPEQKGGLYEPLLPENVELKYGNEYEFRVRLGDLSGGGPLVEDEELQRCARYQFLHRLQPLCRSQAAEAGPADRAARFPHRHLL